MSAAQHLRGRGLKILCAIDGSQYSRCAFQALPYLKIGADSSVTLLHVVNTDQLNVNNSLISGETGRLQRRLPWRKPGEAPC